MDASRFRIREATKEDISGLTALFYASFNAPFFRYLLPHSDYHRKWWDDAFALSLANPADRSFIVEDTQQDGKLAAFSRWQVPQPDGNQERAWPEMAESEFDMEVVGAFFGGMEENRKELMGARPHWFLELLGTHPDYQRHGLASALIRWGTAQADAEGLETYLDASEKGRPFYLAHHDFKYGKLIEIPDRPEYGHFEYVSVVRQPQKRTKGS